ncbi:hypothetical protein AVEN_99401-1 [Araneus ventricosus]|uniref:Uncharacterized protein n=1 Tax=Araneus ventricosus TaxID=182803 RepID=A0A4Y2JL31_ARAVE|nr:hypothetical protein AVEN_99401-1 [Araneus ventricosus]
MTDSSPVWTPDLGDKLGDHLGDKFDDFGDELWDLKGAGIFSISLLGEKIRHECARSFHMMSRPAGRIAATMSQNGKGFLQKRFSFGKQTIFLGEFGRRRDRSAELVSFSADDESFSNIPDQIEGKEGR